MFHLLLLVFSSLFFTTSACGSACLAYQWGYPIWHAANIRYLQSKGPDFAINKLSIRHGPLSDDPILCDAFLCSSVAPIPNPAPVVAPNVETIYAGANLDLVQPFRLDLPPSQGRYFSVHFLNLYTDSVKYITNADFPNGGKFCILFGTTQDPLGSCGADYTDVVLPNQYLLMIVRTFSSGASSSCGVDGCEWLTQVSFTPVYDPATRPAVIDLTARYESLMGPLLGCQYGGGGQPPCLLGIGRDNFWKAICQILQENPLSPLSTEYTYIQNNFASLGINATGDCPNLNFNLLNPQLDALNANSGYNVVQQGLTSATYSSGPWLYIPYTGTWGSDFYSRVQLSTRLHASNANDQAVYYTAFKDSQGNLLNGVFHYKINFANAPIPVDLSKKGFWSLTLYDNTFYLYLNLASKYAIRNNTNTVPAEIHVSNLCLTANCIPAPLGNFNLMLRGYMPLSSFQEPGRTYPLPTITKCNPTLLDPLVLRCR